MLPLSGEVSVMSIEEYDNCVQYLEQRGCEFTQRQKSEIKHSRRKITNREYARLARQRKRNYTEQLEDKVDALEKECFELRQEIRRLEMDRSAPIKPEAPVEWQSLSFDSEETLSFL